MKVRERLALAGHQVQRSELVVADHLPAGGLIVERSPPTGKIYSVARRLRTIL